MKYQLILQWPADSIKDYDNMLDVEESIIDAIGDLGDVDGHDFGSVEMNIFIFTDHPQMAFEKIKSVGLLTDHLSDIRVAYREVDKENYIILFPANLKDFNVK